MIFVASFPPRGSAIGLPGGRRLDSLRISNILSFLITSRLTTRERFPKQIAMRLVRDIENAFDDVVRSLGGSRVDQVAGHNPNIPNCDYIFEKEELIIELKCIEEDRSGDPAYQERLARCWVKWRQAGLVAGRVPPYIDSRTLPEKCALEMMDLQGRGIKKRIAKANSQLRSTANEMGLENSQALLLITNEGNLVFNPPAFIHFLFRTIAKDFSGIHSFVYFTTNLSATVPGSELPIFFWFHGTFPGRPAGCEGLVDALHKKWKTRVTAESGLLVADLNDLEMGSFWQARH